MGLVDISESFGLHFLLRDDFKDLAYQAWHCPGEGFGDSRGGSILTLCRSQPREDDARSWRREVAMRRARIGGLLLPARATV